MAVKKNIAPKLENSVQDNFIHRLKKALPPGVGLSEEMADVLGISIDSAYRRLRGETEFTIHEIYHLSKKYGISVDEVFSNKSDTVTFAYTKLTDSAINFETYLNRLTGHLNTIKKFENGRIFYVAEETPIFYSFFSPKFTNFKLFYWQRSVLNVAEYQQTNFGWDVVPQKLIDIAHNSFKEYMEVPSSEVWTSETVLTGLKQIKFYYDSGILKKEYALELLAENRKMIEMVQENAAAGRKNISDAKETFQLYHSDVVLGTNCIYIVMGDLKYSYITFNTLNSLTTNNPEFCEETEHWMRNLERKSILISGVGEKQRYQFFSRIFNYVDEYMERIKNS
ncbi:MAG: helix-turn-helix domain-containing protein [bacterium]|nr:helix-turn-helix domain-containing protein [bacterium]